MHTYIYNTKHITFAEQKRVDVWDGESGSCNQLVRQAADLEHGSSTFETMGDDRKT